jgi:glycosidase
LVFNFWLMQRMYLALARGDATPLIEALEALPAVPYDCQWATFVRNHDELTLDKLSDSERQEVFEAFGPEPEMQVYGRGLRRRLPPMLGGDENRIRMVYSLLFSLPGTPVLFYGEEIGMGENLDVKGRAAVRTPMQWSEEANAGFSPAARERLPAPVPDGAYGPLAVNVAEQRRDPDSLLNWFERLMRRRKETPEPGFGEWRVLRHDVPSVLAHACTWNERTIVALHNLDAEPCRLTIPLEIEDAVSYHDLFGGDDEEELREPRLELTLEGYGCRWYRIHRVGQRTTP